MSTVHEVSDAVCAILARIGVSPPFTLDAIPGGANNRVFRVDAAGRSFFLKCYRRHPDDPLDRLQRDWSFASLAWDHGMRVVAQPLAADPQEAMGLFAFVPGRRLAPYDIDRPEMQAAAEFFRDVNRLRSTPAANDIANGFEASFSEAEAIGRVDARISALQSIATPTPASEATRDLIQGPLLAAWNRVRETLESNSTAGERQDPLPRSRQCLSPVDFGFHNFLARSDAPGVFHDFEYSGWDDPARMACDFFCQMQLPAPKHLADDFLAVALSEFDAPETIHRRATRLWPLFRIHWCSAVLNDFLPPAITRQRYAGQPPSELRRTRQWEMAELLLSRPLDDVPWTV